tara:strand:+ start:1496 stop:2257 length:762 start_codon:yes stop_codon:yes gene_type:complete
MKHMVIPDTQVKPGCPIDHLKWAGQYAAKKKPDVIVHIGDHWDMPSLSHYDKGSKSFEGRRYTKDIAAGIEGMEAFLAPIRAEQRRLKVNKHKQWNPRLVFTLGNHENRIKRAVESDPKLDGLIGFKDFRLEEMGWEVVPFLQPIKIDGVMYAHYFASGIMGRPVSSARALLTKKHMSCVMGHVQDREVQFSHQGDGTEITGIFAGIFYQHEEDYLNPQTNMSWRGIWMFHEVEDGSFDQMQVSLKFLRKRYG